MARAMKNSGYDWIGQVPDSWLVLPAQRGFTEIKRKNTDGAVQKALQFKAGTIIPKVNFDADSDDYVAETITAYTVVEPGTVMINGLNLNYDFKTQRSALVKERGVITSAYLALQPDTVMITPEFATYLFKGYETKMALHNMGSGIRLTLGWKEFKRQPVLFPPIQEQENIVRYLDRRCSEIDLVIAEIQRSIEEYKKLKQSVITAAVTKGIRGGRPMKDSGVEWIGEIPVDWAVVKLNRIADGRHPYAIGDGDHGLIKPADYQDNGIPYIRVQNLGWATEIDTVNIVYISEETNNRIESSTLRPNDVLFAKTGATIGKTGIVPETMTIANTTSHVGKITVDKKYNPRFVFYALSSDVGYRQFWSYAIQKTTRPELAIDEIKAVRVALPLTTQEQIEIVEYLDSKCAELDKLITAKTHLLEELEVYKKSVIYEYVTGKKEVPACQ